MTRLCQTESSIFVSSVKSLFPEVLTLASNSCSKSVICLNSYVHLAWHNLFLTALALFYIDFLTLKSGSFGFCFIWSLKQSETNTGQQRIELPPLFLA